MEITINCSEIVDIDKLLQKLENLDSYDFIDIKESDRLYREDINLSKIIEILEKNNCKFKVS